VAPDASVGRQPAARFRMSSQLVSLHSFHPNFTTEVSRRRRPARWRG
jgi:hypothetical protein